MRPIRHLTPRYVVDRLAEIRYQRKFPDAPWLTPAANAFLASFLTVADVGFELGSGRSTLWLARRTAHVTSVEGNPAWFERVKGLVAQAGITNVEQHLLLGTEDDAESRATYSTFIAQREDACLDYALVDGLHRAECTLGLLPKLRPGGVLVIDNVNRYLPCASRAPQSRGPHQGPLTPAWMAADRALASWRRFWTTSGITDTAIFFKPAR
jgi:predicted O-methyltransferase YrrM